MREAILVVGLLLMPFPATAFALRAAVKWEDGELVSWRRALLYSVPLVLLQMLVMGLTQAAVRVGGIPPGAYWGGLLLNFLLVAGLLAVLLKLDFLDGVLIQLFMWVIQAAIVVGAVVAWLFIAWLGG